MADFKYVAFNESGVKLRAKITASSLEEAEAILVKQQLTVISIEPADSGFLSKELEIAGGINLKDVEFFTSELSVLLKSGLKIDRGLDILQKNTKKASLKSMISDVASDIRKGKPLSESLENFDCFDRLYLGLVRIAEETGDLPQTFEKLSRELKHQVSLKSRIQQALVYPAVILIVCLGALLFIFNFVVPNLTSLFSGAENLPVYTAALIGLSDWMAVYQFYLLGALVFVPIFLWRSRGNKQVASFLQSLKENIPVLKSANLLVEQIRFNSALYTMMAAGVKVDRAIKLAIETLRTESLKNELYSAQERIRRGEQLADSLAATRLYPPYFASLLSIGEESGDLVSVFDEIAERSRQRFDAWVTQFTNLLEPILIMVMGAIVGSVVVVMMLSITAVTDIQF